MGAALPAARRDSPRYPEGQWRTAITIKRLALRSAKAVKPQRQPPLPPLAASAALSQSRVPSETEQSLASARRCPSSHRAAPSSWRSAFSCRCQELPENTILGNGGRCARTLRPSSPDISIVWELFGEAGDGGGSPWGIRRRRWGRQGSGDPPEFFPVLGHFTVCISDGGSVLAPHPCLGRLSPAFYFPWQGATFGLHRSPHKFPLGNVVLICARRRRTACARSSSIQLTRIELLQRTRRGAGRGGRAGAGRGEGEAERRGSGLPGAQSLWGEPRRPRSSGGREEVGVGEGCCGLTAPRPRGPDNTAKGDPTRLLDRVFLC